MGEDILQNEWHLLLLVGGQRQRVMRRKQWCMLICLLFLLLSASTLLLLLLLPHSISGMLLGITGWPSPYGCKSYWWIFSYHMMFLLIHFLLKLGLIQKQILSTMLHYFPSILGKWTLCASVSPFPNWGAAVGLASWDLRVAPSLHNSSTVS